MRTGSDVAGVVVAGRLVVVDADADTGATDRDGVPAGTGRTGAAAEAVVPAPTGEALPASRSTPLVHPVISAMLMTAPVMAIARTLFRPLVPWKVLSPGAMRRPRRQFWKVGHDKITTPSVPMRNRCSMASNNALQCWAMQMPPLAVAEHPADGGVVCLAVSGELDLATAAELEQTVATAAARPGVREVRVELSGLSFLDASGIGALSRARTSATRSGVLVRAEGARGVVRRVFELTGVGEWLSGP